MGKNFGLPDVHGNVVSQAKVLEGNDDSPPM
jgi:hypothetical protein